MISKISEGFEVVVETFYQPEFSNVQSGEYLFAYKITMHNHNPFAVKLISRYWKIFDSTGEYREVEGDGVVGEQPVINTEGTYNYMSGCNLRSEMGKMEGYYIMQNLNTFQKFKVTIPAFDLIVPAKMN